jgi:hypothetical protein
MRIVSESLHPDAVAEDRSTGIRARRIDRDDPYSLAGTAITKRQLVNQSGFTGSRRSRDPDRQTAPGMLEERLQYCRCLSAIVFDPGDYASDRARITREDSLDESW